MNIINEFFVSFILIKLYFKFKVCRKIKFPLLWKFYFSKWKFYFSADKNKMILDTKWKIPNDSEDEKKQGIEQSDLYQMFAYACKFKIYDIKLVYPLCEKTQDLQRKIAEKFFVFKASEHLYFKEQGQKDIKVQVCFAPLPF